MKEKPKLLFVTDLYYQSKGRAYYKEDLYLSSKLSSEFDLVLCGPRVATRFMSNADIVLFRNTGPVMYFKNEYESFKLKAGESGIKMFNQLTGKGDMKGKQHLLDLTKAGYPVISTIDNKADIYRLPRCERYLSKPKFGADSIDMNYFDAHDLENYCFTESVVQPVMGFVYEVSFYFINHEFQYALYAPNTEQRWQLQTYNPSENDLDFAKQFIDWNDIDFGIQRVDACRMPSGQLLLMELEDLNPYLSLDLLTENVREDFVTTLSGALKSYAF